MVLLIDILILNNTSVVRCFELLLLSRKGFYLFSRYMPTNDSDVAVKFRFAVY